MPAHDTLVEALAAADTTAWEIDEARTNVDAMVNVDELSPLEACARLRAVIDACVRARPLIAGLDAASATAHPANPRRDLSQSVMQRARRVQPNEAKRSSPWQAGLFYLLAFVVLLLIAGSVATVVPGVLTPIVFLFVLLALIALAAIVLRSTDFLSETRTVALLQACLRAAHRLPGEKTPSSATQNAGQPDGS